jgi:hypothetical protein
MHRQRQAVNIPGRQGWQALARCWLLRRAWAACAVVARATPPQHLMPHLPTCSTPSVAPAAAACSPLLSSAKPPNFLRSPSRSPILGWAANASSQPVTEVCRGDGRGAAAVGQSGLSCEDHIAEI